MKINLKHFLSDLYFKNEEIEMINFKTYSLKLELIIFGAIGAIFSINIFCVLYLIPVSNILNESYNIRFNFCIFIFGLKYVLTFIMQFTSKTLE